MKSAVCVLIPHAHARTFLCVSRRNDNTRWGLPGGKVDPGESNLEAAIREVREETGLVLDAAQLEPLYCDVLPGQGPDDTFWVTTYLWQGSSDALADIQPEAGLETGWFCESALTCSGRSPFAAYNAQVFRALTRRDAASALAAA